MAARAGRVKRLDTCWPRPILSVRTQPIPRTDATVHRTALLLLLVLAACRIERTPQELIDPMNPALVDRREAEREVAARVGAFREALSRGSRESAVAALQPLADAHVIGVAEDGGRSSFGAGGIQEALAALEVPEGAVTRMPDLRVQTDTRERMAWFATHLEVFPTVGGGSGEQRLRMSGVFRRLEGQWRLVHLHLSRAGEAALSPPEAPAPDAAPPAGE